MFVWIRFGEVESPEKRCFCIDVTCDNLLDAVKQTVEQETVGAMKRREVELVLKLREAVLEEQQLAAKAARFDSLRQPTPPDISSALELARFQKTSTEGKLTALQASLVNFKGLGHITVDLMDPSTAALQKLASHPRKKAVGLLRAGNTYEAARLDKNSTGGFTSTPLVFSLSSPVTSHPAPA
ncbi:unnamed protein product [Ectocarpus sp. CCAP 1310/34]|nr:unnamed protein product [Ectocarpus sp. CCAP 1310/34]